MKIKWIFNYIRQSIKTSDLFLRAKSFFTSWTRDYENCCGNCHAYMNDSDVYCQMCGTKRGEGKFLPYRNLISYLYGSPIKLVYHCSNCSHKWLKVGAGIRNSNYCPKCKSPSIEILEESVKDFGDTFGDFIGDDEKIQLFTVDEVEKLLKIRDSAAYQDILKKDEDYEEESKAISSLLGKEGFTERKLKLDGRSISNWQAERINLSDKILHCDGKDNAFPEGQKCPRCGGVFGAHIRYHIFVENSVEYETFDDGKLSLKSARIGREDEPRYICLMCGKDF